ncbi:MAG: hypothetical protein QXT33_03460 [Thermofilum sp.]
MDRQRLTALNVWLRAVKTLGLEPKLPPKFWGLPEVRIEVKL